MIQSRTLRRSLVRTRALLLPALLLGGVAIAAQDRTPPPGKKVPEKAPEEAPQDPGQNPDQPGTRKPVTDPKGPKQPGARNSNAYAGEKDPKAKLAIDFGSEKHDFGQVRQGDQLEHTFVLESAGDNPVKIRQASPTCGCTVSEILVENPEKGWDTYKFGDPIEPGKKVNVTATIDTAHKQNRTQVRINVYTNDPIGLTQLAMTADIEPFIRATPTFLNFGDLKEGVTETRSIDIRTARGERVGLTLDPANQIPIPAGMDVALEPQKPDEEGRSGHWKLTVTVGDGAKEGPLGYQVRLLTDVPMPENKDDGHGHHHGDGHDHSGETLPDASELGKKITYHQVSASVTGRVLGPLSISPQFLSMGLVRPGQRVPRSVKLISHDEGFDLSGVTVELVGEGDAELAWAEHFTTSVRPAAGMSNALDIRLQLEGLPDGADGSFRGILRIHTGHERNPQVDVRFSGVCRSGVRR